MIVPGVPKEYHPNGRLFQTSGVSMSVGLWSLQPAPLSSGIASVWLGTSNEKWLFMSEYRRDAFQS